MTAPNWRRAYVATFVRLRDHMREAVSTGAASWMSPGDIDDHAWRQAQRDTEQAIRRSEDSKARARADARR